MMIMDLFIRVQASRAVYTQHNQNLREGWHYSVRVFSLFRFFQTNVCSAVCKHVLCVRLTYLSAVSH